ncbi:LysM peptidoglycan-binding domain-containing protein [Desulfosporosinus sp. Sb-LF]|nr:LysM peptidoglycan-binding domain-containing protein [Desulfosporosinus sp. Sb-LF]
MGLFLWQASIYPVMGEGSDDGAVLSYNVAKDETKKENNVDNKTNVGTVNIVVQHGETLWSLAQTYHTTVEKIVELNQVKSPSRIREGESLKVPNTVALATTERFVNNSVAGDSLTAKTSWWANALRSIPAFASICRQGFGLSRSSDPQALLPVSDSKIQTYEIMVTDDEKSADQSPKAVPAEKESQILSRSLGRLVSKEDVELLTRVIYGEARGENFEGQVAVGAVVLNRLKDPRFPKTMWAIVYQPGAFTAVADRQIHLDPDDQAFKAAEAALSGVDPTNGAIYYYNPRIATDRWIKSRPVIKRIGNHTFSI